MEIFDVEGQAQTLTLPIITKVFTAIKPESIKKQHIYQQLVHVLQPTVLSMLIVTLRPHVSVCT